MTIISFQGRPGAYSDMACRGYNPDAQTLPCPTFVDAISAVMEGAADMACLPCENSLIGRVPEIHALIPKYDLTIVGEYFQRIEHCLLAIEGASLNSIKRVHSHPVALMQVENFVKKHHFNAVSAFDTAGAAELIDKWQNPEDAAIASSLAGTLNNLKIISHNIEDASHNTTRFYCIQKGKIDYETLVGEKFMTTMMIRLPNQPGALYEALRCFAHHNVNMTRIESYMINGNFLATQFLIDSEGHIEEDNLKDALKDLKKKTLSVRILGVYQQSPTRI